MKVIANHGLDESILINVLGWKWISYLATQEKSSPTTKVRVRALFSPKMLKHKRWIDYLDKNEGREADGTEPLDRLRKYVGEVPRLFILVDEE